MKKDCECRVLLFRARTICSQLLKRVLPIVVVLNVSFFMVREMISIGVSEEDGYAEVNSHPRFAPGMSCYRLFDKVGTT